MKNFALCVMMVLFAGTAWAQETQPAAWSVEQRPIARRISDGLVLFQLAADTVHSFRAEDRRHALLSQGCRVGLTFGATEIVKRATHRTRPDGSDNLSFWSGHTATAVQGAGWRYQIGIPIAIGAGYFRMAADRHYLTDVAAGAGAGWLASRVCR